MLNILAVQGWSSFETSRFPRRYEGGRRRRCNFTMIAAAIVLISCAQSMGSFSSERYEVAFHLVMDAFFLLRQHRLNECSVATRVSDRDRFL